MDWVAWYYLGLIFNFVGILLNMVLTTFIVFTISKSPNEFMELVVYTEYIKRNRRVNILYIFNYLLPYYLIYNFIVLFIFVYIYFNGKFNQYKYVLDKMKKYEIGVKYVYND